MSPPTLKTLDPAEKMTNESGTSKPHRTHTREKIDREQTQAHHETANSSGVFSWSTSIVCGSGDCSREHMSSGCVQSSLYSMQGRQRKRPLMQPFPLRLPDAHKALPSQAASPRTSMERPEVGAEPRRPSRGSSAARERMP